METGTAGRHDRLLRAASVAVASASVLLCLAALALHLWYRSRGVDVPLPHAGDLVGGTLFPLVGALVLCRQPRNAAGWVLLSCGLIGVSVLAHAWLEGALAEPGSLPLVPVAAWFAAWAFVPYWAQPALLPVLFPDGRPPSERWRPFVRTVLVLLAVLALVAMLAPNDSVSGTGVPNPLGFRADVLADVTPVLQMGSGLLLWLVAGPVALAGMVRRQRRARGAERAQLQWLMLGVLALLVLTVTSALLPQSGLSDLVFAAGFACVPASVVVAVLRHGMLDVEVVVNRTIVYAGLTGVSVLVYLAVVALAGRWLDGDGSAPLVAGVVVALAASARSRVQRWVDRRLFGARRDPYAVVQRVGAATAEHDAPDAALGALVETVRQVLRVPFVQVLDVDGTSVAACGEPAVGTHVVPVVDRGRERGVLVVGRRSRKERLGPDELSALHDVARRAGALLSAHELTGDLRRSYEQVVRAREEERRRLRRELHDGVGPALAGTALQLDSLAGRLGDDPELARRAERLRDRLRDTVTEVRGIVDGLRPGALDELGLPSALQALATHDDDPVRVHVTADLPGSLPAGVEVAAYRIAGEAVANALRHAQATRASVVARVVDGDLVLDVVDDGAGFGAEVTAGVGLRSMHDRAAEVGGVLVVDSRPGSGTAVRAVLPLQRRP